MAGAETVQVAGAALNATESAAGAIAAVAQWWESVLNSGSCDADGAAHDDDNRGYVVRFVARALAIEALQWTLAAALIYFALTRLAGVVSAVRRRRARRDRERRDRERAQKAALHRRRGTYPPSFPSGWYPIALSDEVARGQVLHVHCLNEDFAVFRSDDDAAVVSVLDAYCPHLGANMAIGGRVKDNCLECPFHLWCFDGQSGRTTFIPYCETGAPSSGRVRSWPVREYYGFVLVYYDADAAIEAAKAANGGTVNGAHADVPEPPYEPIAFPVIDAKTAVYRGSYETEVYMHLQEFAENSVDYAHFTPLHGRFLFPFTEVPVPGVDICHKAAWSIGDAQHIAYFDDFAYLRVAGHHLPWTGLQARITFCGPGGVVIFSFPTPLGTVYLFQSHMPLDLLHQRIRFRWYADRSVPRPLVWWVVQSWITQWARDLMIWENKIYLRKPVLVKGDGPVMQLRRWYAQFYPKQVAAASPHDIEW